MTLSLVEFGKNKFNLNTYLKMKNLKSLVLIALVALFSNSALAQVEPIDKNGVANPAADDIIPLLSNPRVPVGPTKIVPVEI